MRGYLDIFPQTETISDGNFTTAIHSTVNAAHITVIAYT